MGTPRGDPASSRKANAPLAAFVLHTWNWSETSLIVELFTRERGRVLVVAKGAKRPYSQLRPVLVAFQRLWAQLGRTPAEASNEVHLLRTAERAEGPPMPGGPALFAGFYLNELLLKLLARQDAHEALFDAYADALLSLQDADEAAVQLTLRCFELLLLRELGVLPQLDLVTLTVTPVLARTPYTLHPESGVVPAAAGHGGLSGQALLALQAALTCGRGPALRTAAAPVLSALRGPLREVLHYHLGSPQLRSRQVMADVRKLIDRETIRP